MEPLEWLRQTAFEESLLAMAFVSPTASSWQKRAQNYRWLARLLARTPRLSYCLWHVSLLANQPSDSSLRSDPLEEHSYRQIARWELLSFSYLLQWFANLSMECAQGHPLEEMRAYSFDSHSKEFYHQAHLFELIEAQEMMRRLLQEEELSSPCVETRREAEAIAPLASSMRSLLLSLPPLIEALGHWQPKEEKAHRIELLAPVLLLLGQDLWLRSGLRSAYGESPLQEQQRWLFLQWISLCQPLGWVCFSYGEERRQFASYWPFITGVALRHGLSALPLELSRQLIDSWPALPRQLARLSAHLPYERLPELLTEKSCGKGALARQLRALIAMQQSQLKVALRMVTDHLLAFHSYPALKGPLPIALAHQLPLWCDLSEGGKSSVSYPIISWKNPEEAYLSPLASPRVQQLFCIAMA